MTLHVEGHDYRDGCVLDIDRTDTFVASPPDGGFDLHAEVDENHVGGICGRADVDPADYGRTGAFYEDEAFVLVGAVNLEIPGEECEFAIQGQLTVVCRHCRGAVEDFDCLEDDCGFEEGYSEGTFPLVPGTVVITHTFSGTGYSLTFTITVDIV